MLSPVPYIEQSWCSHVTPIFLRKWSEPCFLAPFLSPFRRPLFLQTTKVLLRAKRLSNLHQLKDAELLPSHLSPLLALTPKKSTNSMPLPYFFSCSSFSGAQCSSEDLSEPDSDLSVQFKRPLLKITSVAPNIHLTLGAWLAASTLFLTYLPP